MSYGYSLWESAIVIVIIGIISGTYLELKTNALEIKRIEAVNNQLTEIEEAIKAYSIKNGHLPCPSLINAARDTVNFGLSTDCTAAAVSGVTDYGSGVDAIRIGGVPVKTLGISPSLAIDPWSSRFTYAIVKNLGTTKTTYDNYSSNSSFVIRVNDSAGNMINSTNTATDHKELVAYTIVSHGQDGRGAYNMEGVQHISCGSVLDSENCDNDNVFVDTLYNPNSTSAFDDHLRWKGLPQVTFDATVFKAGGGASSVGCEDVFDPSSFTPSSISNLILWLDGNDGSTMYTNSSCTNVASSFTEIMCWKDKSASALNATNSNSSYTPDWRSVNGYRAVRFNDMEWLTIASGGGSISLTGTEIFIVLRTLRVQDGYVFYTKTDDKFSLRLPDASSKGVWTFNVANTGAAWGGNTTKRFLWNVVGDNSTTSLNQLFRNDTLVSSVNSDNSAVTFGADTMYIGCKAASTTCMKAELYEFIIYTRRLTEDERSKVKAYLNKKWNL